MKRIVAITGTPGVGKTSISRKLHKKIRGSVLIDVNSVAKDNKLYLGKDRSGEKIVDIKKLARIINIAIKKIDNRVILLEGHLLCDMKIDGATAIVLRIHLDVLKKRLLKRKYGIEKIRDNVICEATDYCGIHARRNYRNVREFLSTDKDIIGKMDRVVSSKAARAYRYIELGEDLRKIIKDDIRFAV